MNLSPQDAPPLRSVQPPDSQPRPTRDTVAGKATSMPLNVALHASGNIIRVGTAQSAALGGSVKRHLQTTKNKTSI